MTLLLDVSMLSLNSVGTGPARSSPSKRVESMSHDLSRTVAMLSLKLFYLLMLWIKCVALICVYVYGYVMCMDLYMY